MDGHLEGNGNWRRTGFWGRRGRSKRSGRRQDPGTLFAPTDAAFEALGSGAVKKMLDAPWLTTVLEKRIAHGTHTSADLRNGQLQTWGAGSHVTVEVHDGRIEYGGARVIEGDIKVGDWVIHVIDSVVLPSFVESELSS